MTRNVEIYPARLLVRMTAADEIASTWNECGFRVRPLRDQVFVRTRILPETVGLIYIPPSQRTNYAGLAHQVLMEALVLATGPECRVLKPGQQVAFARLFFARWQEMSDKTLVGWLREDQIACEEAVASDR